jgi:hypothetical protein
MFHPSRPTETITGANAATREDLIMDIHTPTFDSKPDWEPLERMVASVYLADFMHMGRIGTMQLYKHRLTRRYLNIDAPSGRCFEYRNGEYLPIDPECAMRYALEESRKSQ